MNLDSATKARLRTVYPDLATRVIRAFNDMERLHGLTMKVTEGIRTWKYQEELYALGRTQPGRIVTRAKPGNSIHHYGAAVDACFTGPDPYLASHPEGKKLWSEWGRFAQAHGLKWGGDWNGNGIAEPEDFDRPHVELTYGLSLAEIKQLYGFGKLRGVWTRFDQIRGVEPGREWLGPYTNIVELQKLLG